MYPTIDLADYPSIVVPLGTNQGTTVHTHPQQQLTWAPTGVLTMEAGDCRWVVQRSRALWIPSGVAHAVFPTATSEMLSLYFEADESPVRWTGPTVVDATGLTGPLLSHLVSLPEDAVDQRRRAQAVLWDLLTPMSVTTLPTVLPTDPTAARVAAAIRADPADARGLDEWGRLVGASARTLSRRFKAETGVGFESWRTYERLNAALPLLAAGRPISRVAEAVGYRTASAFIAAFRREIGTTPAAYFDGVVPTGPRS